MTQGLARSVHDRLIQHAKALGADPNLVLNRYGTERLLYRLSQSPYADRFILKGGLMMLVWLGEAFRPTRDADHGAKQVGGGHPSMGGGRAPAATAGSPFCLSGRTPTGRR